MNEHNYDIENHRGEATRQLIPGRYRIAILFYVRSCSIYKYLSNIPAVVFLRATAKNNSLTLYHDSIRKRKLESKHTQFGVF